MPPIPRIRSPDELKPCSKCKVPKPLTEFNKNRTKADGHNSYCKPCWQAMVLAHPKRKIWLRKAWTKFNRKTVLSGENRKNMRLRYPKEREAYIHRARMNKARRKGAPGRCSPMQWFARLRFYGERCVYCGSHTQLCRDHRIPLSKGGSNWPANLVPSCKPCNMKKYNKPAIALTFSRSALP